MAETYQPISVLLTGGAGFIGSHVLRLLVNKYPDVRFVCLDKLDYSAHIENMSDYASLQNFKFVKGDIGAADLVAHLIASEKIDTILHFAAQSHVDNSFGNSLHFTHSNVLGTHVLLEAAKAALPQIRRFIHVSTDEVYGENILESGDQIFTENSALNPTNPYAATKAAAEMLVGAYQISFGLPCIITRGNNVFGSHQYPEKLIPKFINLLERGDKLCLHGDGSHRRSFIHVEDVARAFDVVMIRGKVGEIYNIGTEFEISNRQVAEKLLHLFGVEDADFPARLQFVRDRDFNDRRYHIDNSKLQLLGWAPQIGFDEGLARTVQWYHEHLSYFGDLSRVLVPHPRM